MKQTKAKVHADVDFREIMTVEGSCNTGINYLTWFIFSNSFGYSMVNSCFMRLIETDEVKLEQNIMEMFITVTDSDLIPGRQEGSLNWFNLSPSFHMIFRVNLQHIAIMQTYEEMVNLQYIVLAKTLILEFKQLVPQFRTQLFIDGVISIEIEVLNPSIQFLFSLKVLQFLASLLLLGIMCSLQVWLITSSTFTVFLSSSLSPSFLITLLQTDYTYSSRQIVFLYCRPLVVLLKNSLKGSSSLLPSETMEKHS
ncbi:hypothetical protein L873DRAFT_1794153 [Choiromyces venosus 120613-1]|uniref:Uncharacterized protein n=1 Tax=Choiromyces venosus 120613-1 TaxID=1336337 RepID=A0A3N4J5P9_9PEZI|nr:hypothetical protein L873DRAFT_1794153 [Choiromyces venosus 120613-1]